MSSLRANVVAARERLAEGRQKLKQRHLKGLPGIQVSRGLSDLFDALVLALFEDALVALDQAAAHSLRDEVALVAHSGYGRRDVAPYSDVDLMILHSAGAAARAAPLAERTVRDLFDAGLHLAQSVRTPTEACQLAHKDPIICTSLMESRWLAGSEALYGKFVERFRHETRRRCKALVPAMIKARAEERVQYGETVYLLEPNLKRSRGGLRDIQLLRWVGIARHGAAEPDDLRLRGALAREDYELVQRARDFLLRLRHELHFQAGKPSDVLDRVEQLRLAGVLGYPGDAGLLPVEQFMRDYFRHTSGVSHVVARVVAGTTAGPRWGELLTRLFSHQFEGDFLVGPGCIMANQRGLAKLQTDLAQVLRLADVSNLYDVPIAHSTSEAIRAAVPALADEITPETAERFRSLLSQPARLGELLRSLHEMGVLEKIIPAFGHARCLLQFNEYHKFTVDEHCLRAVEIATEFGRDPGMLGRVYGHIKRKWLLHLALLLHDLGKGFPEDHSEVGRRIAQETAGRLRLPAEDAETLAFLVHKHLLMSHLAFRRDTSDDQLVVRFAVEVGSPEVMQILFVLTAADLAAVGPGVLNAWKLEVLSELYRRAMEHLAGDAPAMSSPAYLDERREQVVPCLDSQGNSSWFRRQLAALPPAYLCATSPRQIAGDLAQLQRLVPGQVMAEGRYHADLHAVEYRVGTYEDITPGVFHKLTGALTGRGLQILSAEIHTLADRLVFDRFMVHDPDFAGEPPAERLDEVCRALSAALTSAGGAAPAFRRIWRAGEQRRQDALPPLRTRVRADNNTSDRYTILDIFAADRTGLLYTIARCLFESGLSVAVAKIGTYLDQVVDVFYVTDQQGSKILDETRLRQICDRLLSEIEQFQQHDSNTVTLGRG